MQRWRGRGRLVSSSAAAVVVVGGGGGGERGSNGDRDRVVTLRGIRLPDEAAAADAELVRGALADDSVGRGLSRHDTGDPAIGDAKVSRNLLTAFFSRKWLG